MSFIDANKVYTSTRLNRDGTLFFFFFLFLPGVDAPHVYVRAWALGCFYSHVSTRTFRRALTASLHDSCAEIKSAPFSGVTKSGRVWRKVPESDARSVHAMVSHPCGGHARSCLASVAFQSATDSLHSGKDSLKSLIAAYCRLQLDVA